MQRKNPRMESPVYAYNYTKLKGGRDYEGQTPGRMGDCGTSVDTGSGQWAAFCIRLDRGERGGGAVCVGERVHLGAYEAAGGAVDPVLPGGVCGPALRRHRRTPGGGPAGGPGVRSPAVLYLSGHCGPGCYDRGYSDLSGGGAAGLLGELGPATAAAAVRGGLDGAGPADAAVRVGAVSAVYLPGPGSAPVRGSPHGDERENVGKRSPVWATKGRPQAACFS